MCGVFGIFDHPDAGRVTGEGLYALQHRGQEGAGVATCDGERMHVRKVAGLAHDVLGRDDARWLLAGRHAIGHVRYSTTGGSVACNIQPFTAEHADGPIALSHNGNLINAPFLRAALERGGAVFASTSDSEVILHLILQSGKRAGADGIVSALMPLEGAYSLLILTPHLLMAVRDPRGTRPLCIGRLNDAIVFASETVALDHVGGQFIRDVEPGEVVVVRSDGVHSLRLPAPVEERRVCVLEHVYFARPDSQIDGCSVYAVRESLGRFLAREHPSPADVVIGVPESGVPAAVGYAKESGIPYASGLIRSPYSGRTFIEPDDARRRRGVALKFNAVRWVVEGRRVAVVDDSLVRGNTAAQLIALLRRAGAREVHLRISSPPVTHPCFYGIDIPTRAELVATGRSVADTTRHLGCDSLGYLSRRGMLDAIAVEAPPQHRKLRIIGQGYCDACFTGEYPGTLCGGIS